MPVLPPTAPGLGVEFDEEAARGGEVRLGHSPQLRREDGAFTNW